MENLFLDYEFKFYKELCEFSKSQNNEELKGIIKTEIEEKIRMYQDMALIESQFPKVFDIATARKKRIAYLSKLLKKL